ncbi:MAG: T9SS type A sorting domain-containing protein [Rhodothermales bacterium]|nr:T9SS type A sorting domain-containing protein [Rhodothermales bacterium]
MRWPVLFLFVLALLSVLDSAAVAQPLPQPRSGGLEWELVGEPIDIRGGLVTDSIAWAVGPDGLFYLHPGETSWTQAPYDNFGADHRVFVSDAGTVFLVGRNTLRRLDPDLDGWTEVLDRGSYVMAHTPSGALLAGHNVLGHAVARSTDDGLTWTPIDQTASLGAGLLPQTMAVLPPSAALPGGRIVIGGNDGIAYSDDDGFTWEATALFEPFRYRVISVVQAPWDGLDGAPTGPLYAAVNDFATGDFGGVWESADGAEWERVGQVPEQGDIGAEILAVGDSLMYAINEGSNQVVGVWASEDRGRTWAWGGWLPYASEVGQLVRPVELAATSDGRVWVLCRNGETGPGGTGAVFRTVEPVTVGAEEAGPPESSGAWLEAYPNPSGGSLAVEVTLPEPGAVRVAAYDVAGREVAVVHEGPLPNGLHRFVLPSGLRSGVYVVRATIGADTFTQRVTLLR